MIKGKGLKTDLIVCLLDLFQIIQEHAPDAVKTGEIKHQFGRKVAIVRIPPSLSLSITSLQKEDDKYHHYKQPIVC